MIIRTWADQIQKRFSNTTGGTVFSFIILAVFYLFTKIPYFNLLFTYEINIGLYWIVFSYVYRVRVQITLIAAGILWLTAFIFVVIGNKQLAETIVSNMYILLIAAVVQQMTDVMDHKTTQKV